MDLRLLLGVRQTDGRHHKTGLALYSTLERDKSRKGRGGQPPAFES